MYTTTRGALKKILFSFLTAATATAAGRVQNKFTHRSKDLVHSNRHVAKKGERGSPSPFFPVLFSFYPSIVCLPFKFDIRYAQDCNRTHNVLIIELNLI